MLRKRNARGTSMLRFLLQRGFGSPRLFRSSALLRAQNQRATQAVGTLTIPTPAFFIADPLTTKASVVEIGSISIRTDACFEPNAGKTEYKFDEST